jgi:peptidoglycan/xylan/chitin deacetylase (PgdA/CDA1 family)
VPPRGRVLMYHGFGRRPPDADPYNLFVSAEDFERQVRFLARFFQPLDLTSFLRGLRTGRWPARSVLVTIDDGYVSTLEFAAPLLARYSVPAVAFLCPGRLGGRSSWIREMPEEPLLTAPQVRELPRFGIEVGAHGLDHTLLAGLDRGDLRAQVHGAAEALADLLGTRPRAFSYPEGEFDDAAVQAVRDAGYEVAFSVHMDGGRFAVPRRDVNARDAFTTFAVKLMPGFSWVERSVRHRRLWRVAARLLGQRGKPIA